MLYVLGMASKHLQLSSSIHHHYDEMINHVIISHHASSPLKTLMSFTHAQSETFPRDTPRASSP
jgi:hypothetical protein